MCRIAVPVLLSLRSNTEFCGNSTDTVELIVDGLPWIVRATVFSIGTALRLAAGAANDTMGAPSKHGGSIAFSRWRQGLHTTSQAHDGRRAVACALPSEIGDGSHIRHDEGGLFKPRCLWWHCTQAQHELKTEWLPVEAVRAHVLI